MGAYPRLLIFFDEYQDFPAAARLERRTPGMQTFNRLNHRTPEILAKQFEGRRKTFQRAAALAAKTQAPFAKTVDFHAFHSFGALSSSRSFKLKKSFCFFAKKY